MIRLKSIVPIGAAAAALFAGAAYAQLPIPDDVGLKNIFSDYFAVGTAYQDGGLTNGVLTEPMKGITLREFNSVTHENNLKPDHTMRREGSTDTDIKVRLTDAAKVVLDFAQKEGLGVRGHVFVWHQQTDAWFFRKDMQNDNSNEFASMDQMNSRMKSYIWNLLKLIKESYPSLNLYAYDVVNEMFSNSGGGPRGRKEIGAGKNTEESWWVSIYGNNSFADSAFVYAAQARDEFFPNMKLFYNDYNEYCCGKTASMVALANKLGPKGTVKVNGKHVLDGLGMQSHTAIDDPLIADYKSTLSAFANTGVEIHVTELDVTLSKYGVAAPTPTPQLWASQGRYFRQIFEALMEVPNVTSVSVWGVSDNHSWRSPKNPLLFNSNFDRKPAYDSIAVLVPQSQWGAGYDFDGWEPPPPPPPVEPDDNGYYFHHTFEEGGGTGTSGWTGRGAATVAVTSSAAASGDRSLEVTGRTADWNGAALTLSANPFAPGSSYSFSARAMFNNENTAIESKTFKLTLQYNLAGETDPEYAEVALVTAGKGEWVLLENQNFPIPAGASNLLLYVEMPDDDTQSFFVDEVTGGIAGAAAPGTGKDSVRRNSIATVNKTLRPHVTVRGKTLSVSSPDNSNLKIRLIDTKGKVRANFRSSGNGNHSLTKIPAGRYFVDIRGAGIKQTVPVIIR